MSSLAIIPNPAVAMDPICSKCKNRMTYSTVQPEEGKRFQCEECHHSVVVDNTGLRID